MEIVFKDHLDNDKEYTLTFTRKSIESLEKNGVYIGDIQEKPMTVLPALFHGAFLAKQPFIKREKTDAFLKRFKDKQDLLGKLASMYNEPLEVLLSDPEDDDEGNIAWEVR